MENTVGTDLLEVKGTPFEKMFNKKILE